MTAGTGVVHHIVKDEPDNQGDNYAVIEKTDLSIVEQVAEAGSQRLCSDISGIIVAVYDLGYTTADRHGTQRSDEGRQFELSYQHTVYYTHYQAGNHGDYNRQDRIHSVADQRSGDHGGHSQHGADGQVNVSGDTYDTLSDTYQQIRADRTGKGHQVGFLNKVWIQYGKNHHQDHYSGKCN